MRTTLTLDDAMLRRVLHASGRSNLPDAIRHALQSYLHQEQLKEVLALRGKLDLGNEWRELRNLDKSQELSSERGSSRSQKK
jgi:Bacterial antitoxin of type II TA system, VapB